MPDERQGRAGRAVQQPARRRLRGPRAAGDAAGRGYRADLRRYRPPEHGRLFKDRGTGVCDLLLPPCFRAVFSNLYLHPHRRRSFSGQGERWRIYTGDAAHAGGADGDWLAVLPAQDSKGRRLFCRTAQGFLLEAAVKVALDDHLYGDPDCGVRRTGTHCGAGLYCLQPVCRKIWLEGASSLFRLGF